MAERKPVLRATMVALAISLTGAPLAAAHAQTAASRDDAVKTRVLGWTGGERLFVSTHADVRYVQGQNARVVVTGPASEIEDIVVDDGVIRRDDRRGDWFGWFWTWRDWRSTPDVRIVVTAPHIAEAGVSGSGHLDLGRLAQDRLQMAVSGSGGIDVSGQIQSLSLSVSGSGAGRLTQVNVADLSAGLSGSGWIKASGAATALHLQVSGSGAADMGGLVVQDVDAHLSGSGSARLSPKRSADLGVSGSGSIRLLTEPPRLNAHRSGSGAIIHPNGVS